MGAWLNAPILPIFVVVLGGSAPWLLAWRSGGIIRSDVKMARVRFVIRP
jgi:hypothetical protein